MAKKIQTLKIENNNWRNKLSYALVENNELKEMLESVNEKLAETYKENNLVKKELEIIKRQKNVWAKLGSIFHGKE